MKDQIVYQNDFRDKGHECPNLVIRCMDFRFHGQLGKLLDEMFVDEGGFGSYDSPGIGGGGSKSIIDVTNRPVVFSAVDIAVDKHHLKRIVIVDHVDCGAYGGSSKFNDLAAEEEFHIEKLKEAREIISEKYPQLKIILLYQDWEKVKSIQS